MKLIKVQILGENFRSLPSKKEYEFNVSQRKDRLSTKIFAGLNGSGKSNFLELIAEIFYFLERFHLETVSVTDKKAKNIGFEIEYILPLKELVNDIASFKFGDEGCHVRIKKNPGENPEFSYCKYGETDFIRRDYDTHLLLPNKIIAYTSGQNELLSKPFFKMKYHYFNEFEKNGSTEVTSVNNRMFFIDNSLNSAIFVANMLLASTEKLTYLKETFKVEDLRSFRITLNLLDYKKKSLSLSDKISNYIAILKRCATTWVDLKEGSTLVLDFNVNEATHEAFSFYFKTSFELFNVLYELESLNLNLYPKNTRNLILNAHKSINISEELFKPDPSSLVFRIEQISISKFVEEGKPAIPILYKGLSDGEHQFNEVVGSIMMMEQEGCLFLMDEPDTHFNPMWRSKMIEILNHVCATKLDNKDNPIEVRNQEIIITTHSPFVISDSYKEDVYKFDKGESYITFANPKIETYGASISILMQEIFDREISISDLANFDLDELRESFKVLKTEKDILKRIEEAKEKLLDFGESIEKFDLYSYLRKVENTINKKK